MRNNKKFVREKIIYINAVKLFFLVYFSIYITQSLLYPEGKVGGNGLLLLGATLFSVFCGQKMEKLYKFLLSQMVVVLYCVIIARDSAEKILFVAFSVLLIFAVLGSRREERKRWYISNLSLGWLGLLVPGIFLGTVYHIDGAGAVLLRICLVYFWLHYINKFFANQLKYIEKLEQTSRSIREKDFIMAGNKVLFFFSFISMGALVAGSYIFVEGLEGKIGRVLHRLLRWLLHFLNTEAEENYSQFIEEEEYHAQEGEVGEVSLSSYAWLQDLMEIIQEILIKLVQVVSIIAVVGVVILCCYMIWKSFYEKRIGTEVEGIQEVKEKIKKLEKQKNGIKRRFHFFRNNNEKVRHIFYKQIMKNKKEAYQFRKGNTAADLKKAVHESKEPMIEGLLPYYNKARYSDEDIHVKELEECAKIK